MSNRALRIILGDRIVAYHLALAKVLGGAAEGLWMSQLLYWDSVKLAEDPNWDGWFYKSESDIMRETCLTHRECRQAKKQALLRGVVECKVIGMPAISHYRINFELLEELICTTSPYAPYGLVRTERTDLLVPSPDRISGYITQNSTSNILRDANHISSSPKDPEGIDEVVDSVGKPESDFTRPLSLQQRMVGALCTVCHKDVKLNAAKFAPFAKKLLDGQYTPEDILTLYGTGTSWFYAKDWRAQKGDLPNISSIADTIKTAKEEVEREQQRYKDLIR